MLALGRLVEAGSAFSLEAQGRKAKCPAQAERGVGDVLFFPAAAAPSEKESRPWESVGKRLLQEDGGGASLQRWNSLGGKNKYK